MKIIDRTITDFLDKEYKSFAQYVVEGRAIPSVIDSFKPVQRKVIFSAIKNAKKDFIRVAELGGSIISECKYHHGSVSGENCILLLTAPFKNNLPLFDCDSQCGSLRAPEPPSARYVDVRLSSNFDLIYKDLDLIVYKEEDGKKIEPYYYLPIVPTILFNSGSSGISIGHATYIANRNPLDVTRACISYLNNKEIGGIRRFIHEYNGSFKKDESNHRKWIMEGKYVKGNGTITITELPPSMTYEKYEEILDKLVEDREILSYENLGQGEIRYICKLNKEKLELMNPEDIIKMLKLRETDNENFTVLDQYGKIKIFESDEEIIGYFIDFRLTFYETRKRNKITILEKESYMASERAKFIKMVVDDKIIISKRSKKDIEKDLTSVGFKPVDNNFDYLLNMSLYNLTSDRIKQLEEESKTKEKELISIKKSDPKKNYIEELEYLEKKIVGMGIF